MFAAGYLDLTGRAHWQSPSGSGDVKGRMLINPAQIEIVYRAEAGHSTIVLASGKLIQADIPLDELKGLLGSRSDAALAGIGAN